MFQPHGYGPLAKMGEELAQSFADGMAPGRPALSARSRSIRAARSIGRAVRTGWPKQVRARGGQAEHIAERAAIGEALLAEARDGDRIVIMGARDDTLSEFAARAGRAARAAERALDVAGMAKPGTVIGWMLAEDERERLLERLSADVTRMSSPTM